MTCLLQCIETEKKEERNKEREREREKGREKRRKNVEKNYPFCDLCTEKVWKVIFQSEKAYERGNPTGLIEWSNLKHVKSWKKIKMTESWTYIA